jgi:hypothetical protein
MPLTDWLLFEVELVFIGLTHTSIGKKPVLSNPLGRDQSSFRLPAQLLQELVGQVVTDFPADRLDPFPSASL